VTICVAIALQKGVHDPKNKDKEVFVLAKEELQYAADKLGIRWKDSPSK